MVEGDEEDGCRSERWKDEMAAQREIDIEMQECWEHARILDGAMVNACTSEAVSGLIKHVLDVSLWAMRHICR
jgi:hypothetical protein